MEPNKPLTELSNQIGVIRGESGKYSMFRLTSKGEQVLDRAQLIIAELAKIEEPVDRSKVKPSIDGRVHFADILKADEERAFDVLRRCREIAAGKQEGE